MERVAFLIEETNERIGCLLNPETLVMRRVAGVRPRRSATGQLTGEGLTDDPLLYTGGGRTELDLDLLFDVSLAGSSITTEDVRDLTLPLWELAENADRQEGYGQPPLVRFIWGKSWNIPGVILAVSERLESFTPEGVPRRSWLRLRMLRANEPPPDATPARSGSLSLDETEIPEGSVEVSEVIGGAPPAAEGDGQETPPSLQAGELTATTANDIAASALDESGAQATIDAALGSIDGAVRGMLADLSALTESGEEEGDEESVPEEERAAAEAVEAEAHTILTSLQPVRSAVGSSVIGAVTTATATIRSAMATIGTELEAMASEAGSRIEGTVNAALETMAPAIEAMRNAAATASQAIQKKSAAVIAAAVQGIASAAETIEAGLQTVATTASDLGEQAVTHIESAAETVGQILEEIRTTGKTVAREHLPAVLKTLASGVEGLWIAGETAAVKAVESAAKVIAIALKNVRAAAEATAGLLVRETARGVRSVVSTIHTVLEAAGSEREGEDAEAPALATVVSKAWSRIQTALDLLTARADQETREGFSEARETLQSTVQALGELGTDEREAAIERITEALATLTGAVDAVVAQEKDATAALVKSAIEKGIPEAEARARREAQRPRGGPGQRLDLLAHRHYGDPALWRVLAAFNNVEHPLHLTSGQLLRVPPASALRSGGE